MDPQQFSEDHLRTDIPDFRAGDTVGVNVKVVEGGKERLQRFEGVVLSKRGTGTNATFTVPLLQFLISTMLRPWMNTNSHTPQAASSLIWSLHRGLFSQNHVRTL